MTAVMHGVRVLEVAEHTFVPAASALLSDWGAEVIKIEHVERGDAMRALAATGVAVVPTSANVLLEHSNRGKRSLGLDLGSEAGREILYRLAASCDVFLTNKLPAVRSYDPTSPFMQGTVSTAAERAAPARFEAVDALRSIADQAGITLTTLALAFVSSHPAITSTIIGPRTARHLDDALDAADVELGGDVLDAIDKIVPPGVDLPDIDHFTQYPSLLPAARRRPPHLPA
ncbi:MULTISPECIES: aldo/keto reductase [Pseudofrankia]|uniref:aldo/keto reductase n=1 Tax=Pseudofrankia TaxID=2994363 RepID=UPI000234CA8E